jgi:hypothetical protein
MSFPFTARWGSNSVSQLTLLAEHSTLRNAVQSGRGGEQAEEWVRGFHEQQLVWL